MFFEWSVKFLGLFGGAYQQKSYKKKKFVKKKHFLLKKIFFGIFFGGPKVWISPEWDTKTFGRMAI